jgi:hypothetical protein
MIALRDWLNLQLGPDGGRAAQIVLALLVVVLLLVGLTMIFRRLTGRSLAGSRGGRLGVVDAAPVDAARRLVLLRRDDVEHLVMIGGPNDLLVESRIVRSARHPAPPPISAPVVTGPAPTPAPIPEPEPSGPATTAAEPADHRSPADRLRSLAGVGAGVASVLAGAGNYLRTRAHRETAEEAVPPVAPPVVLDAPPASEPPRPIERSEPEAAPIRRRPRPEPPTAQEQIAATFGNRTMPPPVPADPVVAVPPPVPTRIAEPPMPPRPVDPAPVAVSPATDRAEIAEEIRRGLDDLGRAAPHSSPAPVVAPPAPAEAAAPTGARVSEAALMSELDLVVSDFAREFAAAAPPRVEPAVAVPPPPIVEPRPEPVVVAHEPPPAPPIVEPVAPVAAPEVMPPKPAEATADAAQTPVDELEAEMARLLAELSTPPRR